MLIMKFSKLDFDNSQYIILYTHNQPVVNACEKKKK